MEDGIEENSIHIDSNGIFTSSGHPESFGSAFTYYRLYMLSPMSFGCNFEYRGNWG